MPTEALFYAWLVSVFVLQIVTSWLPSLLLSIYQAVVLPIYIYTCAQVQRGGAGLRCCLHTPACAPWLQNSAYAKPSSIALAGALVVSAAYTGCLAA